MDGLRLLKVQIGLPEPYTIPRRTMDIWQTKTGLGMGWKINLGYHRSGGLKNSANYILKPNIGLGMA